MRFRFTLIILGAFLAAATASAQAPPEEPDFSITAAQRTEVVEHSIARLDENYVFPEVAKKMGELVRAHAAAGAYDGITRARALADALTADFRSVSHDKHLQVFYSNSVVPPDGPDAQPSAAAIADRRQFCDRINAGFEKVERMDGNIGYVDIRGFVPPELGGETASAAMTFVANTDALIIDLRNNHGGTPAMISYVLSYLFDEPAHMNDIYNRVENSTRQWWTAGYVPGRRFGGKKPVFVLTSHDTFSGGEEMSYDLKNTKRATLIGETTGGGAHPVRPFRVSDHFQIGVPFARAINPVTKTNWEGTGVAPDVSVKADDALDTAYRMAIDALIASTDDATRKDELERARRK